MPLTTFSQARKALEPYWPSKHHLHRDTLAHVQAFMDFLGNPQDRLRVIHVAGTSGKTSTAYYVAALLKAAGKKVGLTVSPHVDEVNERVQINGHPLAEKAFCTGLDSFLQLVEKSGIELTYFEVLYTYAFWQFAQAQLDYAVVEVGVGGLMDSTNVINREDKICVITDIGFDHMNILGSSLTEIAEHKAGIIQLHNSVFCYRQNEVVMAPIIARAKQKQADLHLLGQDDEASEFHFLPLFQQRNLGLARAAANWALHKAGEPPLSKAAVLVAAHTLIPGRMETIKHGKKTVIVDAAHNSQKLTALRDGVQALHPGQPTAAIVSLLAGRDYRLEEAAAVMAHLADHLIITSFAGPIDGPHHSVMPEQLLAACKRHGAQSAEIIADPAQALDVLLNRPEPLLLVTGSFYLLNHIRPLLKHP